MTPEEITALARELANDLYNDDRAYNSILWWCEEPKERKAKELEHTLRFLLRRFCLVEKDKLQEAYLEAKITTKEGYKTKSGCMIAVGEASKALLESLFPEIAKEVEG